MEEKLARIFHLVNMVFTDIDFPVCLLFGTVCFLNISQSELEAQALLVLQESSSQLMPFSAFGAVIEILWITLGDQPWRFSQSSREDERWS